MKLSHTMLNFMGYVFEDDDHHCSKSSPEAFLSHFGAVAAIKNGLLKEHTLVIEPVLDAPANPFGLGMGGEYPGYQLTELGKRLGDIGKRMRKDDKARRGSPEVEVYLKEGQALLNKELA